MEIQMTRLRSSAWVALVLLLSIGMAGCSRPESLASLPLPPLHIGDVFDYEGDDGSTLRVKVEGLDTRRDGALRQHDVVVLEHLLTPGHAGTPSFRFEEAIDLAEGLVVQQVAECAALATTGPGEGSFCYDDQQALVLTSTMGLPGTMGSSTFWKDGGFPAQDVGIVVRSPLLGRLDTYDLSVERAEDQDGCRSMLAPDAFRPPWIGAFFWLRPGAPFVMCSGYALPYGFQAAGWHPMALRGEPVWYHLVGVQQGDGPIPWGAAGHWDGPGQAVPVTAWSGVPFAADPTEEGILAFTSEESHVWAMEQVPEYRDAVTASGAVLVLSSQSREGTPHDVYLIPGEGREYVRSTLVLNDAGEGLKVAVKKTVRTTLLGTEENYSLESVERLSTPLHATDHIAASSARVGDALQLLAPLVTSEICWICGRTVLDLMHNWRGDYEPWANRTFGHTIYGLWQDPHYDGGMVIDTWYGLLDAESGTIMRFDTPTYKLPFA